MSLYQDSITFGKYKGSTLDKILRDRNYCEWLLSQDWFQDKYEYLYNRVKEYNPHDYFIQQMDNIENIKDNDDFLNSYPYFNLVPLENLQLKLSPVDSSCYEFYLQMLEQIKTSIYYRLENEAENPYDIKTPNKWLKHFEEKYGIPRSDFKDFISAYELPNITTIIERIKNEGGMEYKGAKSYKIAKKRSKDQENWWENILKNIYGEDIGVQFKYENCIFDFVHIPRKIIYECKLGLKDFDHKQHQKYKIALKEYKIIYLISKDCIIDITNSVMYTSNSDYYTEYINKVYDMKNPSYLDNIIENFNVVQVDNINSVL